MTHPVKPGRRPEGAGMTVINGFDGPIKRLRLAALAPAL
jgi:hypothetical protein